MGCGSAEDVAEVLARVRDERRPGAENTTTRWQVRIKWGGSRQWPQYTFDAKNSREDAEYCAGQAVAWNRSDTELYVLGAWVRSPGAAAWDPVPASKAVPA
jgi:hypothetical protein